MPKLDLNVKAVRGNLTHAFSKANEQLEPRFRQQFDNPAWAWPRSTLRKSGQVVSSPRSIVDSGALRDSYTRRTVGVSGVEHTWDESYASLAHEGGRTKTGLSYPARPFTKEPLERLPEMFADEVGR